MYKMKVGYCDGLGENGLYATKNYDKGSTVRVLKGKLFSHPTRETIHIGDNQHIYDKYGIFINHSFSPNVEIVGTSVIALVDIEIGDEIMFNYNNSEVNMCSPFYVDNVYVCGKQWLMRFFLIVIILR